MYPFATAMFGTVSGGNAQTYDFVAAGSAGTIVGGGGSQTLSIPYPTGIRSGHILFAHVVTSLSGVGTHSVTTPSGWSVAASYTLNSTAYDHHVILWKRADGTESGSLSVSVDTGANSGFNRVMGTMSAWGGCVTSGTPFATPVNSEGSSASAASASITLPASNLLVLNFVGTAGGRTATPPASFTEAYDNEDTGGFGISADLNYATKSGTVSSQTTTLNASAYFGVITLALYEQRAAPSFTVDPSITSPDGFYGTGDALTGNPGTHTGGSQTYQWRKDGADIAGETGLTYTIQSTDSGAAITFTETAYAYAGQLGASDTATSSAVTGTGDPVYATQTRTLSDSSNRTLSDSSDRTISNRTA